MEKEFVTVHEKQTTARVLNTKISAVRVKDIVKKGARVYKEGKIGVGGAVGQVSDDVILQQAEKDLDTNISYPYNLQSDMIMYKDLSERSFEKEEFLETAESILKNLRENFGDFDFSESISTTQRLVSIKNSKGLDLIYKDEYFSVELVLKENKSSNLFDGYIAYRGRRFDPEEFWKFNNSYLGAYKEEAKLPEGDKIPVVTMELPPLNIFLNKSLNGESYANKASIFSEKIGKEIFNKKVTVEQSRDPQKNFVPFFDMEGVVLKNYSTPLIKDGVLANVYTDKRTADKYKLAHTGGAAGSYDDIPTLGFVPLRFNTDTGNLKEALGGKPGIFVVVSSGGDFTSDGNFAAPVQLSFLFDGEKIIGKLPEFTMRSHLYKMLGEDYIGTFDNPGMYVGDHTQLMACNMEIAKE